MKEQETITYTEGTWVALTKTYRAIHIIPVRVGKEPSVPFGAVGRITQVVEGTFPGEQTYNIAFHAGWMALGVPGSVLREARMLEQLALCADGC